jgi:hypothetical protein
MSTRPSRIALFVGIAIAAVALYGMDFGGIDLFGLLSSGYEYGLKWILLAVIIATGVFLGLQLDHLLSDTRERRRRSQNV